jgi:peptidoglycan/LPS O-acetylase OafA/YrhL
MAAIAVLLHHSATATVFTLRGAEIPLVGHRLGEYAAHMDAGVQVFFLISGFLLYRPFVASAFDEREPLGPRVFFRRRFLRIFPAYWIALIGIALFIGLEMPIGGARSLTEYFLLIQLYDWTDHGLRALGGISQSWTLVVELSFYAFLPVYAWVMRRIGGTRAADARLRLELYGLAVLYAISLAWRALVYWGMPDDWSLRLIGQYWLPAHLDLFAMGMALAVLRTWLDRRRGPVRAFEVVGRFDWACWILAAVAFHVACTQIGLPDTLTVVYGGKAYLRQLFYGLTALFLLLPAVFGPQERGPVRRFLRFGPVAYLGLISYGIYLWHQAFIKKIHQWGGWAPEPGEPDLLGFRGNFAVHALGALALSVVVASLSWFLVERPLLARKDRPLFRGRMAPTAR